LTGAGRNDGIQATSNELVVEKSFNLGKLLPSLHLALNRARALLVQFLGFRGSSSLRPLLAQRLGVMCLIPLPEGGGIDLNDGVFNESVGALQLVVRGVVDHRDETSLPGHGFGAPREVAGFEAHGAELDVATANAYLVNALGAQLRVGGLATQLELSLLAELSALGTSRVALVTGISANT